MRSKRHTRGRYVEAAELQTVHPETKKLFPRRWIFFGPRVVPVALWVASLAKHQDTMDVLVRKLRGQVGGLEASLARHKKIAAKTQAFIEGKRERLDQAAKDGISAAEFIEREKAGASAHWKRPAHGPDGRVLPVGTEEKN
jgi:hypothetical protein